MSDDATSPRRSGGISDIPMSSLMVGLSATALGVERRNHRYSGHLPANCRACARGLVTAGYLVERCLPRPLPHPRCFQSTLPQVIHSAKAKSLM
jgi:hypothetical protein